MKSVDDGVWMACIFVVVVLVFWASDFEGMRSKWMYHRECRKRQALSDDEFYARYYKDSGIEKSLVVQCLHFYCEYFGETAESMLPQDDLFRMNEGLDSSGFDAKVETQFGVRLTEIEDIEQPQDGKFDTFIRIVAAKSVKELP